MWNPLPLKTHLVQCLRQVLITTCNTISTEELIIVRLTVSGSTDDAEQWVSCCKLTKVYGTTVNKAKELDFQQNTTSFFSSQNDALWILTGQVIQATAASTGKIWFSYQSALVSTGEQRVHTNPDVDSRTHMHINPSKGAHLISSCLWVEHIDLMV